MHNLPIHSIIICVIIRAVRVGGEERKCVGSERAKRVDSLPMMNNEDAKGPSVECISWIFFYLSG